MDLTNVKGPHWGTNEYSVVKEENEDRPQERTLSRKDSLERNETYETMKRS